MDALEGGSISRACSKLGIICAMKTKALNLLKNGIDIIALFIKLRFIDFSCIVLILLLKPNALEITDDIRNISLTASA